MLSTMFENDESKLFFPTPTQFRESALPQDFPFSMPIMKYIWENPSSSQVYQKLIESCKIFFIKNPIILLKHLEYQHSFGWYHYNSNKYGYRQKRVNTKIFKSKIWITKQLAVSTFTNSTVASNLIPKLCRYDVKVLELSNQILSYDEFKFLVAGVEDCQICNNTVTYKDDTELPLDEIIKLLFDAKIVTLLLNPNPFFDGYTRYAEFFNACCTVKKISFSCIADDFDMHEFYQQMKRNKNHALITICSWLFLRHVNEIIDEILATESFDFVPPVFEYGDPAKRKKMEEIQSREIAKYR